jgi:predicted HAD superfamily Cof-like phosphohydrolase
MNKQETITKILESIENILEPRVLPHIADDLQNIIVPDYLEKVAEFNKAFDIPIRDKPDILAVQELNLIVSLMHEEIQELMEANCELPFEEAKVEVLDALVDLQYFVSQAILRFGMQDVFEEAFARVHKSNMDKTMPPEDLNKTIEHYLLKNIGVEACTSNGKFYVKAISGPKAGKVLKPYNWQPPILNDLV